MRSLRRDPFSCRGQLGAPGRRRACFRSCVGRYRDGATCARRQLRWARLLAFPYGNPFTATIRDPTNPMPKHRPLAITPDNALEHLWYCYQRVVVMAKHKRALEKYLHGLGPARERTLMSDVRTGFPQRHITYTSFQYASLSTLIEGYQNRKAAFEKDTTIEKLLDEDDGRHVAQLRDLRDSVFHWSRLDDPRFVNLFKDKRTRQWCAELARAFQRYITERID